MVGVGMATFGGAPSGTGAGGVVNQNLSQVGNCILLLVMLATCWWMWPTYRRTSSVPRHPNHPAARFLLCAAAATMPFQLVRLACNTAYAFTHEPSLDPITGSFATRLGSLFFMQLGVSLAALAGGWFSRGIVPRSRLSGDDLVLKPRGSSTSRATGEENDGVIGS